MSEPDLTLDGTSPFEHAKKVLSRHYPSLETILDSADADTREIAIRSMQIVHNAMSRWKIESERRGQSVIDQAADCERVFLTAVATSNAWFCEKGRFPLGDPTEARLLDPRGWRSAADPKIKGILDLHCKNIEKKQFATFASLFPPYTAEGLEDLYAEVRAFNGESPSPWEDQEISIYPTTDHKDLWQEVATGVNAGLDQIHHYSEFGASLQTHVDELLRLLVEEVERSKTGTARVYYRNERSRMDRHAEGELTGEYDCVQPYRAFVTEKMGPLREQDWGQNDPYGVYTLEKKLREFYRSTKSTV